MNKPKLTIVSLCYNHEKYISQTLESFVMQKTNFPFEVIIADDFSTDNSANIIKKFAEKYPDIIKPIFREKNWGPGENCLEVLSRVKSEYMLYNDGDDYFTDPFKLQKQVDFLEFHPECSICFHPVRVFYEDGSEPDSIYPSEQLRFNLEILHIGHLLVHNFIQTNSVMYRWRFNDKELIQDVFPENIIPGDYFLHLLHAQKGKIGFIDEVMADYRKHSGGVWWGNTTDVENLHLKYGIKELKFYLALEKTFPEYQAIKGHSHTLEQARLFTKIYLKHKKFKEMNEIMDLCPDLFTQKLNLVK